MRGAMLVASFVGVLLAGSVSAASTARVTITESSLTPKVARISAPGSVTWTNKGTRLHVVVSTTNAFKPVVLQVGRSKTVRFARTGSYPYLVDGKRCGFVAAGGTKPAKTCGLIGGQSPAPPPPPSDVRKETLRYDIDIVASLHTVETFSGRNDPGANGVLDRKLAWTGKWRRIELEMQIVGEARYLTTRLATATRGSITGMLNYSESRSSPSYGPCSGMIAYPQFKAKVNVSGGRPDRGKRYVSFDEHPISSSAIDQLTESKQKAACRGYWPGLPRWGDSETSLVIQGVNIHHPPGLSIHPMDTRWQREAATGTPFPLDRLLAGRGFTLDTGVRTSRRTGAGYLEKFTGRARYIFRPAR